MHNWKRLLGSLVLAATLAGSITTPSFAVGKSLKWKDLPQRTSTNRTIPKSREGVLLVMPSAGADSDEVSKAISEASGEVIGQIGEGSLLTLIVRMPQDKINEAEKKLSKDEHFGVVQRDYVSCSQALSEHDSTGTNDPYFSSQWHLAAMNVAPTLTKSRGYGVMVAIADTGCESTNQDLWGKTYTGVDVTRSIPGGHHDRDRDSHGTLVATTACAKTNNRILTASPANLSGVFPIVIASPEGVTSDIFLAKAVYEAGKRGYRVLNISYNSEDPCSNLADRRTHPVLHAYLMWYHDQRNGLAFFPAGNGGRFDSNPRLPYMIVVSALDQSYELAKFSNYGNPVWFTAPGCNIVSSTREGRMASVSGTSFACPLVAAVAAQVIARNGWLKNTQVEQILINSCLNAPGKKWNSLYGFGLIDADRAVTLAR